MSRPKFVAVSIDGEVMVHAASVDPTTLCGIDANDDAIGHRPAERQRGALIDCPQCYRMWQQWRRCTGWDFSQGDR